MLRIPHCLDNRLADGGGVVRITRWPRITSRKIYGTHFCYKPSRPKQHNVAGRIRPTEISNDRIENGTRDLPAHPTTLPRGPPYDVYRGYFPERKWPVHEVHHVP
jgi:hypothetical protein